jgi:hypothetical protein
VQHLTDWYTAVLRQQHLQAGRHADSTLLTHKGLWLIYPYPQVARCCSTVPFAPPSRQSANPVQAAGCYCKHSCIPAIALSAALCSAVLHCLCCAALLVAHLG